MVGKFEYQEKCDVIVCKQEISQLIVKIKPREKDETRSSVACERRRISGGRFSPPKREKRQPEIRLRSQARSRANTFEIALIEYFASTIFCAIHGANY